MRPAKNSAMAPTVEISASRPSHSQPCVANVKSRAPAAPETRPKVAVAPSVTSAASGSGASSPVTASDTRMYAV